MNIDVPEAYVELVVGPGQSPEELRRSITVLGELHPVHDVRVSKRMKATQYGDPDTFTITRRSPDLQPVSGKEPTLWKWAIKPVKTAMAGQYPVHVELEAEVKIDGEVTPRLIDTFDGPISVTITGRQRVEHFVRDNWQWL